MTDDLITQAFSSHSLPGEGLFIIEGNPSTNDLRIIAADVAYKDNLNCFTWNINTGYFFLGIFIEEGLAKQYVEAIKYEPDGDELFQSAKIFVVEGNPLENELKVSTAATAFQKNLVSFELGISTGYQYLGAFTTEESASDFIVRIRTSLRDLQGKRLI